MDSNGPTPKHAAAWPEQHLWSRAECDGVPGRCTSACPRHWPIGYTIVARHRNG